MVSKIGIPDLIKVDKLSDILARYRFLTTIPKTGIFILILSNTALPLGGFDISPSEEKRAKDKGKKVVNIIIYEGGYPNKHSSS